MTDSMVFAVCGLQHLLLSKGISTKFQPEQEWGISKEWFSALRYRLNCIHRNLQRHINARFPCDSACAVLLKVILDVKVAT